jgi:hypothetical protein
MSQQTNKKLLLPLQILLTSEISCETSLLHVTKVHLDRVEAIIKDQL